MASNHSRTELIETVLLMFEDAKNAESDALTTRPIASELEPIRRALNEMFQSWQLDQAAIERAKFLETVLSSLPGLVSYMDRDLRYHYVNNAYERWFGVDRKSCLGKTMHEIVGPVGVATVKEQLEAAFSGYPQDFQLQAPYKFGGIKHVHVQYIPDRDTQGAVRGLVVIVHDVTELKEKERELRLALERSNQLQSTLSEMINSVPVGIATIGTDLKFIEVNTTLEKMLGYSAEELKMLTIKDISHKDDQAFSVNTAERTFSNPEPGYTRHEKRYLKKSGEVVWARISAEKRNNASAAGGLVLTGVIEDVTNQRLSELKLAEATHEMQKLIDGVPVTLSHWDRNLNNLAANSGYTINFGKKPSDIRGKQYEDVIGPLFEKVRPYIDRALQGETSFTDTEFVKPDGTRAFARVTFQPDFKDGEVVGLFTVGVDTTKTLEMERALELERAKNLRSAKLASLGEMSAGLAHEINNPLAIIEGSANLLPKFLDNPAKLQSKIDSIKKSCDRISRIVMGLKKFSRSGDKSKFAIYSVRTIIDETLVLTAAKSARHATPIEVQFECPIDTTLFCDDVEIEQVLINLINNSIDAVKTNAERWIKLRASMDQDAVVLRVEDSGRALSEDIRKRLFEPFFTTKKVGEGTGLGLSISKGILDEHHATISILEDTPNTCFEIRFPKLESHQRDN